MAVTYMIDGRKCTRDQVNKFRALKEKKNKEVEEVKEELDVEVELEPVVEPAVKEKKEVKKKSNKK